MKRQYEKLIHEYLGHFPCVVLVGARQTGKSTLIGLLGDGREIFDLEIRADYNQIAQDPDLFLRLNNKPIAIDEAQLLPGLFPALRVAIDKDRKAYGKYLLSGSSSPELITSISESLAGRVGIIEIAPFSFSETEAVDNPRLLGLLLSHPQMGNSWEGMVVEEILRTLNAAGIQHSAYYYRTSAGAEIDLILEGKFGTIPIEIKHTQSLNLRHLRPIRDFIDEFDCAFGVVVSRDEKARMFDDKILGIPFSLLTQDRLVTDK